MTQKKAMYENTEFTLSRDCEAIQIPSGQKTTIPAGTQGVITQSLGGSYTVATYQGLARVAEKDLDALGLGKPQTQEAQKPARADGEVAEEDVWNQLRQCYDPEIPVNIVDLGLVYDCRLTKKDDGCSHCWACPLRSNAGGRNGKSFNDCEVTAQAQI